MSGSLHRADHPRLFFQAGEASALRERAAHPRLAKVAERLFARAEYCLSAGELRPSLAQEGEPIEAGRMSRLGAARCLQGRVLTLCMAFTLSGAHKYRDAAVAELDRAVTSWPPWLYNPWSRPFDLMTGEMCMTLGLAYDWLYNDLSDEERGRLREGGDPAGVDGL